MTTVVACIDGSAISTAVCDAAAWASQRLDAPLKLLHVLEKTEPAISSDFSGNIGPYSREHLLEELTVLDEQRGRLALEHGKLMLEHAEQRARTSGVAAISKLQRHGNLAATLLELEAETRLLVLGRLGEGHDIAAHTLGSHLESVVRSMHRPILVAVPDFAPPTCFTIAYDGSDTAAKALSMVATSPLLKGLPCHLVTVGDTSEQREQQLEEAGKLLTSSGFEVAAHAVVSGDVQTALSAYQADHGIDLVVMGAYGHSRIRQFFVGSNTTRMISSSRVPLLLLR